MSTQTLSSHEHAREYFRRAREKSRLSHAYLLVGAPGIGKARFCLDFARTLFCENDARGGCDCRQCRSIEHG
ncbi:MAG: DNA polymerase III subunit delta', partial [Planctomycetes bacterium]|nr:DNA polymerase III subunit delta' [Planctomycetota bacterium]